MTWIFCLAFFLFQTDLPSEKITNILKVNMEFASRRLEDIHDIVSIEETDGSMELKIP